MVEQSYSPQVDVKKRGEEGETSEDKIYPSDTFLQADKMAPCVKAIAAKPET